MNLADFNAATKSVSSILVKVEDEENAVNDSENISWAQSGAARTVLD